MTKKQIEYSKIKWEIESLLFTQEHRILTDKEIERLKLLEEKKRRVTI